LAVASQQHSLDGGLAVLTRSFAEAIGAPTALLLLWDESRRVGEARATWGLNHSGRDLTVRPHQGATGRLLAGDDAGACSLLTDDWEPLDNAFDGAPIAHVLGAPVPVPGGNAGALCAGFTRAPRLERELLLWTAESYAAVTALCLEGSGLLGALVQASQEDELTGCLNYAGVRATIDREIARSERNGQALSCCFVDLDGFKRVNDRHGHLVGNRVLAVVARELRQGIRRSDVIGRYGGDEFVVVLPETDDAVAVRLAQRLRREVALATGIVVRDEIAASIGVAEWSPGGSADELLERADQALRAAKEAGGGVIAAPPANETRISGDHRRSPSMRRGNPSPPHPTVSSRPEDPSRRLASPTPGGGR
jgi:diguanylate cyclase (GGDEF)-like protein